MAKQGKDLKFDLQHGDGSVWDNLHDNSVWLDFNPELKDVIYPLPRTRDHERRFMEPTLEILTACPIRTTEGRPHPKPKASLPPRQHTTPPVPPTFVNLQDDNLDEHKTPPARPNNRTYAYMMDGNDILHSRCLFRALDDKRYPQYRRQSVGGDQHIRTRHKLGLYWVLAAKDLLPTSFVWY